MSGDDAEFKELTVSSFLHEKDQTPDEKCKDENEAKEINGGHKVKKENELYHNSNNEECSHFIEIITIKTDNEQAFKFCNPKNKSLANSDDTELRGEKSKTENISIAQSPCSTVSFFILDNLISLLIVGPLNVFFWRGVWEPMERHFIQESLLLHGIVCFILGNVGILTASFCQTSIMERFKSKNVCISWLMHICYTYTIGALNVIQWQGVWILLDAITGKKVDSAWICFIFGYFLLCALRCIKSAHGPPMCVLIDTDKDFYRHTTRFNTEPGWSVAYVLDSLFTITVIHTLVVVYWRGSWLVLDHYLFPEDEHLSAVVTVIGSATLHVAVCCLQPVFNHIYRRASGGIQRIALEIILFSCANMVAMSHWRGVWMLVEIYILPERPDLSCALTQLVAIFVLSLMLCGQSVTSKGCDVDGDSSPDDGCLIPNQYIRYFVEKRRRSVIIAPKACDVDLNHRCLDS